MKTKDYNNPENWKYDSPTTEGFHEVITGKNSSCKSVNIFRLNLSEGNFFDLYDKTREMSAALIKGKLSVTINNKETSLDKLDSFYIPAGITAKISAQENAILYIGAALYEEIGEPVVTKYNPNLEIGEVRQVHGKEPYRRDVYMTLGPHVPASRLITGLTWSDDGAWSSWPPHQHENDLDECYCYFDMDAPKFGLHLSYRESGKPEVAHIVSSGDCVVVPQGYHPTVATPGVKNAYFWVLAAHSTSSRRYDLAKDDPAFT